jgi:hypothetical protein
MPILERVKNRMEGMPKFETADGLALAMECLAFCMVHVQDHQYLPKCVWLNDQQYSDYISLYPEGTDKPMFFGIPVIASKGA